LPETEGRLSKTDRDVTLEIDEEESPKSGDCSLGASCILFVIMTNEEEILLSDDWNSIRSGEIVIS
jgi:hypothetical protein